MQPYPLWKICNINFQKWGEGVKGRLEFFQKFIRFGRPMWCQPQVIEPVRHGFSSILLLHFLGHPVCNENLLQHCRLYQQALPPFLCLQSRSVRFWMVRVKHVTNSMSLHQIIQKIRKMHLIQGPKKLPLTSVKFLAPPSAHTCVRWSLRQLETFPHYTLTVSFHTQFFNNLSLKWHLFTPLF